MQNEINLILTPAHIQAVGALETFSQDLREGMHRYFNRTKRGKTNPAN
jgi:hypothetical protein